MKRLLLASSSPWRLGLLKDAGIPCEAVSPGDEEESIHSSDPLQMAVGRAVAKARAVARRTPGVLVIGADQVAHLDGEVFGKPHGRADWLTRLELLRGRTHHLTTGVALVEGEEVETFSVTTGVRFRADVEDQELLDYIGYGEAAGCAGGYQVERLGAWLVEATEGDWWNVIGLPLLPLISRLRARGWRLQDALPGPREEWA